MDTKVLVFIFLEWMTYISCKKKKPVTEQPYPASAKFDNPNYIRDRYKTEINKHEMPERWKNRFVKPWNPAYMDYCAMYHCNDYHTIACGLNRKTSRFKWFQSVCHMMKNNKCKKYLGTQSFDLIETKWCTVYVFDLRAGCPAYCEDDLDPVCAVSSLDMHVVLFKNPCALEKANCANTTFMEYEQCNMDVCDYFFNIKYVRVP